MRFRVGDQSSYAERGRTERDYEFRMRQRAGKAEQKDHLA